MLRLHLACVLLAVGLVACVAEPIAEEVVGSDDAVCCGATCCFIDGACRTTGETNPADACEVCNPGRSQFMWSPSSGPGCVDAGGPPPLDAGLPDAGRPEDGGSGTDAGGGTDSGGGTDAGGGTDSGGGTDAGGGRDSGGGGTDAGGGGGGGGGCSTVPAGSTGGAPLFLVLGVGLLVAARRRRF
jgi:MYXO-CTERM domain-containing protein